MTNDPKNEIAPEPNDTDEDADDGEPWYGGGFDDVNNLPDEGGDRLYMKKNEERLLLFLDGGPDDRALFKRPYSAPFLIWEYQIPVKTPDGINWRNWVTCVKGRRDKTGKPLRDIVREEAPDLKPYYVGMFTVVDLTEVKSLSKLLKNGDPLVDPRRFLLPAKRKLLKSLARQNEKREGLRGCMYRVYRTDADQAASTGDEWEFEDRLSEQDMQKLLPENNGVPFAYHEILAPQSENDIQALLKHRAEVDRSGRGGRGGRDGGRGGRDGGRGRDRDDRDDDRRSSRSRDDDDRSSRSSSRGGGGYGRGRNESSRDDPAEDLPF